jgi:hypothetical protein
MLFQNIVIAVLACIVFALSVMLACASRSALFSAANRALVAAVTNEDKDKYEREDELLGSILDTLYNNYPKGENPERMIAHYNIDPEDKVLELGGNIGCVSSVILSKLNNTNNLLVVEPVTTLAEELRAKNMQVFNGALIPSGNLYGIECTDPTNGDYATCHRVPTPHPTKNKTLAQIKSVLNFNVVVIDCEGCYEDLLPEMIGDTGINTILIEWDGQFQEQKLLNGGFHLVDYRSHTLLPNGVRCYKR